jgi:hypothetical protein
MIAMIQIRCIVWLSWEYRGNRMPHITHFRAQLGNVGNMAPGAAAIH